MKDSFWIVLKDMISKSGIDEAVVIGNGKIETEKLDLTDKFVININTSFFHSKKTRGALIIVKSVEALTKILEECTYEQKDNKFFILTQEVYDSNKAKIRGELINYKVVNFFDVQYGDMSLLNNLAIYGIEIAKSLGIHKTYLTGFSFDVNILSNDAQKDYNEIYFEQQKKNLDEYIAGNSYLTVVKYKDLVISKKSTAKTTSIHELITRKIMKNETIIVAEFTNNHVGDTSILLKMVELAQEQGADLIKIQKRDVKNFYTEKEKNKEYMSAFGSKLIDYRKGVELSADQIELLDEKCRELDIPWFASVLDYNSYVMLNNIKTQQMIKLPSTISEFTNYIDKIANIYDPSAPIVISTGATDINYVNKMLEKFYNHKRKIFLLHTLSAYPTPDNEMNLGIVNSYKRLQGQYPNLFAGYSGHTLGYTDGFLASIAGANMVEKHVNYKSFDWIHFDKVALSLKDGEFKKYVDEVKKADALKGNERKVVHSIEHHKYKPNDNIN